MTKALATPGVGDEFLDTLAHRVALGLAAIVSVLDPELVILTGSVLLAGGDPLLTRVRDEFAALAVARPTIAMSGVPERPVLHGALHAALVRTRDDVFDTIQSTQAVSST